MSSSLSSSPLSPSDACRLIVDPPKTGAENMAIDEALLSTTASTQSPTLRIYRWSEPTLSLGYFQPYLGRDSHPESAGCQCVRRHSGGGAIMHDQEVTYSLVTPVSDRWSAKAGDMYRQVHQGLADWYTEMGAAAKLAEDGDQDAFLCFLRRSDGDLLVDGNKVTGSAQRRHRGAILQHGSILLRRSEHATELPGLFDLGFDEVSYDAFAMEAAGRIGAALGLDLYTGALDASEAELAVTIGGKKFADPAWTTRR